MTSLEDKLKYLKDLNNIIISLEGDIMNMLSQNQTLSKLKNELEEQNKEINKKNEELIALQSELLSSLDKKDKELFTAKNEFLEQNYFANNESIISLGINNLSVRNSEAIHDALSYFDKKCPYCNEDLFFTTNRKQFEIDHFFPVVKGGQDVPWNLLPVCHRCNRKKKAVLPHVFLESNTFKNVSQYLNIVHNKYLDEGIDSYTFKEKIRELIEKENDFIINNIRSEFITTLLYLAEKHNIIKEGIVYLAQKENHRADGKTSMVIEYLDKKIPEDWKNFDLIKRANFLKGDDLIVNSTKILYQRNFVCVAEIWCECFGNNKEDMDRYNTRDINTIMKSLDNWKQSKSTKNFAIYGKQKFYERKNTNTNKPR